MSTYANTPSGYFPDSGGDRYSNPFYGIPLQYLPMNMDGMLWWSNHFLLRFGFYRSVLFRISNYFITSLNIECDDSAAKKKYQDLLNSMEWKHLLSMAGLNLLAYSNLFCSVSQGFNRFLICPNCKKVTSLERIDDYNFGSDGSFSLTCRSRECGYKGVHQVVDKPTSDINKLKLIFWNPREIKVRYDETTGASEYFWDIPPDYKNKVTQADNKFYSKKTPKVIFDTLRQNKMLAFNDKTFLHVKLPTPAGIKNEGKAIPLCMYLFDDFFMLKVLQRHTEALCFEDIVPFRVLSMSNDSNPQANPLLTQSGGQWLSAVNQMIKDHRKDPGAYHTFPFPINYQQMGAEGKRLAPTELIQQSIANILNALYVPQELYTMNMQMQAVGPALRLFENSWSILIAAYNQVLNHLGEVIGKIKGLPEAKISLIPVTLSDDMERKSMISQLVSANAIARSELLNLYNFDYREQLKRKKEEEQIQRELDEEDAAKQELLNSAQGQAKGTTPNDVISQAQEIAKQLFPMDMVQRRQELQKIKAQDATLYSAVKQALEELTASAGRDGVEGAKQQAQ